MLRQLLLGSLILLFSTGMAQDYGDGFVIRSSGDTLLGQVAYQSSNNYLTVCKFRIDDTEQQLYPADIRGYGFKDGRFFVSGINIGRFVEVHILGELSFYRADSSYFLQKGSEIYELKSGLVYKEVGGQSGLMEDTKWKGIASIMIGDCIQNPMARLSTLKLQIKPMSKLVMDYNECRDAEYVQYRKGGKGIKVSLGLTAGFTSSTIGIKNDQDARRAAFFDIVWSKCRFVFFGKSYHWAFCRSTLSKYLRYFFHASRDDLFEG